MKVLGVVQWTEKDKRGSPIAGVRPLVELQKGEWRSIDPVEEFPSQGQVFWPNAQGATEDSLVIFRAEPNAGHKDEFRVVDPKPAYEVLDLRRYGTDAQVRSALVEGLSLPGPVGVVRALLWCKPDLLVGPVELNRMVTGTVKLGRGSFARVPSFSGGGALVRSVVVGKATRWLRIDDGPPSGYVDWDDDAAVLRRALEAAVKVAKHAGNEALQTKKQIEEAARELAAMGVGPDAQLDRYRVERATSMVRNTEVVARTAGELVELLREHRVVKASLAALSEQVRADIERSARAEVEQLLERERTALRETTAAHDRAKLQLEASEAALRSAEGQLVQLQTDVESASRQAEASVHARLQAALERPLELLAEVSVLRPFLVANASVERGVPLGSPQPKLDWSRARGEDIRDKASLRRTLTSAARAHGVDPSLMLQIHAATMARLLPVTLGAGALAALSAYAQGACGGRLLVVHVSPGALQPQDFDEIPGGGLTAAAAAASAVDGASLVVLEGANRSPLEASVVPLLQLTDIGRSPLASAPGLRLAASLVAGATTVPVTPQLWSHAVAIYPEPSSPSAQAAVAGDVRLSSELFAPGDEPAGAIDGLLEAWPDCRELRPALSRFGSALTRLYEESRVTDMLVSGLVLPYLATALSVEEQAEALARAGDADGAVAVQLRRLRRRLV